MTRAFLAGFCLVALAACSESPDGTGRTRADEPPDAATDGGARGAPSSAPDAASEEAAAESGPVVVDLAHIGEKPLDSLTREEARALCAEDARRTDPCLAVALSHVEPEACRTSLDACEANRQGKGEAFDRCEGASYGALGTCSVTVDDYLACIDAWSRTQTCEYAGRLISTPPACAGVVDGCIRFADDFRKPGRPPPCDPHESPVDTDDDIFGDDGCRPVPSRFVVLGDSIAECFGESPDVCASDLIPDFVRATYAPGLAFETHAAIGARTIDLPAQARKVDGGPGHVAVWIWVIGNDLLLGSQDYPGWEAAWRETFAYFTDETRFPDGVTFLLNGQYSIFDECGTEQDLGLEATLRAANRRLFLGVAEARPDTIAVDHYPDWLGHTYHADERGCPHCGSDNSSWLGNGPHPSATGYAHITDKWKIALTRMYGASCAP